MAFELRRFRPEVAAILDLECSGESLMPLAGGSCSSTAALEILRSASAPHLFPGGRAPEAALAGLYLYFSCLDQCHSIAQDLTAPEGSYWHAIMHRQEPDASNSAYWFRRVGRHPIIPAHRDAAASLGYPSGKDWDPFAFIDCCESARRCPGSPEETLARRVQLAEWQLLFEWCALPGGQ